LIHRLKALPPLAMIAWPVIHPASSPASMRMTDVFRLGYPVDDLAAEAAADDRLRRGPSIIGVRVSEGARR
jgi:hypothetical protein